MPLTAEQLIWLNRLGIILNFLAGFMLAPELLGLENLRRIEASLEWLFSRIRQPIRRVSQSSSRIIEMSYWSSMRANSIFAGVVLLLTVVTAFQGPIRLAIWIYVVLLLSHLVVWYAEVRKGGRQKDSDSLGEYRKALQLTRASRRFDEVFIVSVFMLNLVLTFLAATVSYIFLVAPTALIVLAERGVSWLIQRLEGDDKLRVGLVFWGIIFFIVGNLFQLIATFTSY